MISTKHTLYGL